MSFRSNHKNFTVTLESATGTVTVTCQYDFEGETSTFFNDLTVALSTHDSFDWTDLESEMEYVYGFAYVDEIIEDGTVTLIGREQTTDIPFGNYYLYANGGGSDGIVQYSGTLTVDSDEEITITLSPVNEGD